MSSRHCSGALKQVHRCVIRLSAPWTGGINVFIDPMQVGPKVPVVSRSEASKLDLVPPACDLLLFALRDFAIDGCDVAVVRATWRISDVSLDEGDDSFQGC